MFETSFHECGLMYVSSFSLTWHGPSSRIGWSAMNPASFFFSLLFTLKQANQRVTSRATVQPQRDGCILWIVTCLKEPEKGVCCGRKVHIARIRFDTGGGLADTRFARLLVANSDIVGRLDSLHARRFLGQLAARKLGVKGYRAGCCKRQQPRDPAVDAHSVSNVANKWALDTPRCSRATGTRQLHRYL